MTLMLRSAARSDVGLLRSGNEDSGYAGDQLLVVADGMGGHAAGEHQRPITVIRADEIVVGQEHAKRRQGLMSHAGNVEVPATLPVEAFLPEIPQPAFNHQTQDAELGGGVE